MIAVAQRVARLLPESKFNNKKKEEVTTPAEGDTNQELAVSRNINSIVRVLDALGNNESQFESLDFLITRIERLLRKDDYYSLLTSTQHARLLKIFA